MKSRIWMWNIAMCLFAALAITLQLSAQDNPDHQATIITFDAPGAGTSPVGVCCLSAHAAQRKIAPVANYGTLPPSFEVNRGQTDARVKFLSRGVGYTVFLTSNEAVLSLSKGPQRRTVTMAFSGSSAAPAITGRHALPGKSNYFIGNDPGKWRTNIPSYAEVLYKTVYSKIDLLYHANQRQLEFDFMVAPHGDANAIELTLEGASEVRVDDNGDLLLSIDGGEIRFNRPRLYQPQGTPANPSGRKTLADGAYVVTGKANQIPFAGL